jgi:MoaA/NifB/PqqE/SkfB family radical SAM enzyme
MDLYSFYNQLKSIYAKASRNLPYGYALPLMNLVFEITYRCNLKCSMCYQRNQEKMLGIKAYRKNEEITISEIKNVIDQTPPFCIIIFSGGEPFCRKDIMEILKYATKKRRCHIVTNAALMKPEDAHLLVDLGLLSIGVSVDGDAETHDSIRGIPGTFERTARNIREIKKYRSSVGKKRPVINLKTVISNGNINKLIDIYSIGKELGVDYCTFQLENTSLEISALHLNHDFSPYILPPSPVQNIDRKILENALTNLKNSKGEKPAIRFIPNFSLVDIQAHYDNSIEIDNFICQAPWIGMNISPYGEVFPCFNYSIGNIKNDPILKLWNNPRFRLFRQTIKRNGLFEGCVGCCDLERKLVS